MKKDLVLSRMFQDEYIEEEELKQAILQWMTLELKIDDSLSKHHILWCGSKTIGRTIW